MREHHPRRRPGAHGIPEDLSGPGGGLCAHRQPAPVPAGRGAPAPAGLEPAGGAAGAHAVDTGLLDRLPRQVSGGELQRIALARVLLMKPALIFADEPTSRLDPLTQQEVIGLLVEEARAAGCAVLLVTHDTDIVRCVADRQIRLGS
jgi:hypothetical protein